MTFTIGADPEIFLKKNGKFVSAHGMVNGTKESPKPVAHGAVQVDGTALEFNIDPSAISDFNTFNFNVVQVLKTLKSLVPGYSIAKTEVADFDEEYLKSLPKEATELGCDPDFNAYTKEVNPMPDGERTFRSGAGHIHLGWGSNIPVENTEHFEICAGFVKTLDATVGLASVLMETDPRRRELYGKAGAFRPKPYGVEYRTPSNQWIFNLDRRKLMHEMLNRAVSIHSTITTRPSVKESFYTEETIREIIDSGDKGKAFEYLNSTIISGYDTRLRTLLEKVAEQGR